MKAILDIPNEEIEIIKRNGFNKDGTFSFKLNEVVKQAIRKGVILSDNTTNGDIVESLFGKDMYYILLRHMYSQNADKLTRWWNAPYKGGQEE